MSNQLLLLLCFRCRAITPVLPYLYSYYHTMLCGRNFPSHPTIHLAAMSSSIILCRPWQFLRMRPVPWSCFTKCPRERTNRVLRRFQLTGPELLVSASTQSFRLDRCRGNFRRLYMGADISGMYQWLGEREVSHAPS
jgi:hypothetical protein